MSDSETSSNVPFSLLRLVDESAARSKTQTSNNGDNVFRKLDLVPIFYAAERAGEILHAFAVFKLSLGDVLKRHRDNNLRVSTEYAFHQYQLIETILLGRSDSVKNLMTLNTNDVLHQATQICESFDLSSSDVENPDLRRKFMGIHIALEGALREIVSSDPRKELLDPHIRNEIEGTIHTDEFYSSIKDEFLAVSSESSNADVAFTPDFDFSALSEFLKFAKFFREELFSKELKNFEPMVIFALERGSSVIDSESERNCKNLQFIYRVERLLLQQEEEIERRKANLLAEISNRRVQELLFRACYVHYALLDKKFTLKRDLFTEKFFDVCKAHVEKAEAKIASIEDYNDSSADGSAGLLVLPIQQAELIVSSDIDMLSTYIENCKRTFSLISDFQRRRFIHRIHEALKLECRIYQVFDKSPNNVVYTKDVLETKKFFESKLDSLRPFMERIEADLKEIDKSIEQSTGLSILTEWSRLNDEMVAKKKSHELEPPKWTSL